MRPVACVLAGLLVASLATAGCGDEAPAGGEVIVQPPPVPDAMPRPDARSPPPYRPLDIEWQTVVDEYNDPHTDLEAGLMMPTGIAIITHYDIYLADKTDGHAIAKATWSVDGKMSYVGSIVRESGNLALLAEKNVDGTGSGDRLFLFEFARDDLSLVRMFQVVDWYSGIDGSLAELNGKADVVANRYHEASERFNKIVIEIENGMVPDVHVHDLGYIPSTVYGSGIAGEDGRVLFCLNRYTYGPAEIARIDPTVGSLSSLTLEGNGSDVCQLVQGPDRILAYWKDYAQASPTRNETHWDILSRDGKTVLASHHEFVPTVFFSHAYVDGDFVTSSGLEVTAIDAETANPRGPYTIPVEAFLAGQEMLVSDDLNLYAAVILVRIGAPGEIRLLKLAPLPKD